MIWIDVVLIIMLALFAIIGYKTGFLATILSFVNSLVSIIIAFFLAKPFAKALAKIGKIESAFTNLFANKFEKIGQLGETLTENMSAKEVIDTKAEGLSSFFRWIVKAFSGDTVIEAGQTPSAVLGQVMGAVLLLIVAFVVMFVAIRIIVAVLTRLFKKLNNAKVIGPVNRVSGLLLGLLKGFLFVAIVLIVVSIIPYVSTKADEVIQETFVLKQLNIGVHKTVEYIGSKIDLNKMISGLFKKG